MEKKEQTQNEDEKQEKTGEEIGRALYESLKRRGKIRGAK